MARLGWAEIVVKELFRVALVGTEGVGKYSSGKITANDLRKLRRFIIMVHL